MRRFFTILDERTTGNGLSAIKFLTMIGVQNMVVYNETSLTDLLCQRVLRTVEKRSLLIGDVINGIDSSF